MFYTKNHNYYYGYGIKDELKNIQNHYNEINENAKSIYEKNLKVWSGIITQLQAKIKPLSDQCNKLGMQRNAENQESIDAQLNALWNQIAPLEQQVKEYNGLISDLHLALSKFQEAIGGLNISQLQKYEEMENDIINNYYTFKSLADTRKEELANYRSFIKKLYLPLVYGYMDGNPLPDKKEAEPYELQYANEFFEELQNNKYTFIPVFTDEKSPNIGVGRIDGLAKELQSKIETLNHRLEYFDRISSSSKRWEDSANDFKTLVKPTQQQISEFIVFVDKNYNYKLEFEIFEKAAKEAPAKASKLNSLIKVYTLEANTEISNLTTDVEYLLEAAANINKAIKKLEQDKIIESDSGSSYANVPVMGDYRLALPYDAQTGMVIFDKPYRHYAIKSELAEKPEFKTAYNEFKQSKGYKFLINKMPGVAEYFDKLFRGEFAITAKEENFFINDLPKWVVYKSDLEKIPGMIQYIDIEKDDFIIKIKEISKILPHTIIANSGDEIKAEWEKKNGKKFLGQPREFSKMEEIEKSKYEGFELGKKYIVITDQISLLIDKRNVYLNKKAQQSAEESSKKEAINYFTDELNKKSIEIDKMLITKYTEYDINVFATDFYNLYNSYLDRKLGGLDASFKAVEAKIEILRQKLFGDEKQEIENVKNLYNSFKSAYESRNESQIMNMISGEWDAGDGTTLSDLEENLRNMFTVFDSIQYNIANLNIQKSSNNNYNVSYDVEIIGNIYSTGITRNEKSSVYEQITIDKSGKAKIYKTLRGNYWYIK